MFTGSKSEPSYDVALVGLSSPSSAPTVMLPNGAAPSPGDTVWAAGYGIDDSGQTSPDLLRYTSLSVFADSECPTVSHCVSHCVAVTLPWPLQNGGSAVFLLNCPVRRLLPAG